MDDQGVTVYLVDGEQLRAAQMLVDRAKNEIHSPAMDEMIDAVECLIEALRPLASPIQERKAS